MRPWILMALPLAALACGGGSDTDTDGDTDGGGPDFTSCAATDGNSPSITAAEIECLPPHQDGADRMLQIDITATDPQGDFTLKPFGDNVFRIYRNDTELYNGKDIACSRDNAGSCSGSVNSALVGVDCGALESYRFTAVISDDDGNLSPECDMSVAD